PSYLEQLVDSYLQTEPPPDASLSSLQSSSHYSPENFQTLCLDQNLVPGSPDSSDLSSPLDYSYSPSQLPPFVPLNYSSPSPLDPKTYVYSTEECSYHQQPQAQYGSFPSVCYCTSCGSEHLDTFKTAEYFPYQSTDCIDYPPTVPIADNFFRRDRSCDICYS
uniref:POU class 2 homeobox associating factor 3 n=1 Tax=Sphenodon punctatus TaxID=8508 RepID=A0A8D0L7U6_SPHPU